MLKLQVYEHNLRKLLLPQGGLVMFNTDKPIRSAGEDLLGRSSFAKRLAASIMSFSTEDNYAIALQGVWGCGKTSVLNMAIEEIERKNQLENNEKVIVVRFNPWNFTDTSQLISQFFLTLSETLKVGKFEKGVQSIGSLIENYSATLEYTEYIPLVGKYLKILPKLSSRFGKSIKSNAEGKINSVTYQRTQLEEALKKLKQRILIVIDDIDRLSNEQIRLIFQLVNSVAGFPYMTYLLSFDKEVVTKALSYVQSGDGALYLEKIIQVPFDMPPIKTDKLYAILTEKLDSIAFIPDEMRFDSTRWYKVFKSCISPFISTLRDVHRFYNTFSFAYSPVKYETDFIDMAGICALQVFAPPIYDWIKSNRETLVGGYGGSGIALNEIKERREEIIGLFKKIYPQNPDIMIEAVSSLFPAFSNRISYLSDYTSSAELHQVMRVADANKFDLYFSLSPEDVKISRSEIDDTIFGMDEAQLSTYVSELYRRKLFSEYVAEVRLHLPRIPENRIEILIKALIPQGTNYTNNCRKLDLSGFSVYTLSDLLFRVSDEGQRFEIIQKILLTEDFHTFQFLMQLIHIIELSYGRIAQTAEKDNKKLVSMQNLFTLEQLFVDQINKFVVLKPLLDWEDAERAAILWRFVRRNEYVSYIQSVLVDNLSAMKFLCFFVGTWTSNGRVCDYEIKNDAYAECIDTQEALKKIEAVRLTDPFWNGSKDMSSRIAAFSLCYRDKESPKLKINATEVEEEVSRWEKEYEYSLENK